jgi:hypothetical protein
MHPQTKPPTTRTPNVSATGSVTNGVDVFVRASPYGTSQRCLIKSKAGCILTPEQCLMSITMIAHQAQGMHAGEVIAKLAEDAYFMRVDNRVTQLPPLRTREADHEATSQSPQQPYSRRTTTEPQPH